MHIKKHILTAAAAFCLSGAVRAQSDWTGFYLGVTDGQVAGRSATTTTAFASEVGYAMVSSNWDSIHASGIGELKPAGYMKGFTAGFNWQHGHGFLGLEADRGQFRDSRSRSITTAYPIDNEYYGTRYTITQRVEVHQISTYRLRGGFASGRWLIYGTAGVAKTRFDFREEFSDDFDSFSGCSACSFESGEQSESRRSLVWGGGAEFRFAGRWSVKGEYLQTNFGTLSGRSDNLIVLGDPFPMNYFTYSAELKLNVIRVGVNYRF